LAWLNNITNYH